MVTIPQITIHQEGRGADLLHPALYDSSFLNEMKSYQNTFLTVLSTSLRPIPLWVICSRYGSLSGKLTMAMESLQHCAFLQQRAVNTVFIALCTMPPGLNQQLLLVPGKDQGREIERKNCQAVMTSGHLAALSDFHGGTHPVQRPCWVPLLGRKCTLSSTTVCRSHTPSHCTPG